MGCMRIIPAPCLKKPQLANHVHIARLYSDCAIGNTRLALYSAYPVVLLPCIAPACGAAQRQAALPRAGGCKIPSHLNRVAAMGAPLDVEAGGANGNGDKAQNYVREKSFAPQGMRIIFKVSLRQLNALRQRDVPVWSKRFETTGTARLPRNIVPPLACSPRSDWRCTP